jgi:molybdopterin synthase catalytic subunit
MAQIITSTFEPAELLKSISLKHPEAGAIASFVGHVRPQGGAVTSLFLEHYPGFTQNMIENLEAQTRDHFGLLEAMIVHRVGLMLPGEAIVMVIAAAHHRKPAIGAIDFMMDHLKTDAPFWKKEMGAQGENWIDPSATDYCARASWDEEI